MIRYLTLLLALGALLSCSPPPRTTITVIGTNDVHGALVPNEKTDGLVTISGYISALRAARREDGGAVVLIDAGDMWQGTLESNLAEGASMVEAYNALGYTAVALGNHEFDFGPAGPLAMPKSPDDDPRGALKARASEAEFPVLAANLIDLDTGEAVRWPNVQPSVLLDVNGIKVGIIGVMTEEALSVTLAANTVGLTVAPIAATVEKEAQALRDAGATVVIVSAHASTYCDAFDDPADTSSCDPASEVFAAANALPPGLVDHIHAGHSHMGTAHIVNGISITQGFSNARFFSRADLVVDRSDGRRVSTRLFPPIPAVDTASYEGFPFAPDPEIHQIAARATAAADELKNREVGIRLDTPFLLTDSPESPLGNLYTDGLLAATGADIAIHTTNTSIRADLRAGELTYGQMFEMSPYDNQITLIELSGRELRQVIAEQAHRGEVRINFSGMRVSVACLDTRMTVTMVLDDGEEVGDEDAVRIAVVNYLALGGDDVFVTVMPDGGYELQPDAALAREAIIAWLQARGGSIRESDFSSGDNPKWTLPEPLDSQCRLN